MQFVTMLFMKEKDIVESRDFTAKLYNNEPLPGTEQYVDRCFHIKMTFIWGHAHAPEYDNSC